MNLYHVTIHRCIEYTDFEIDVTYHFNSEDSMNKWIEEFNERNSSLEEIVSYGKSKFNKRGILVP